MRRTKGIFSFMMAFILFSILIVNSNGAENIGDIYLPKAESSDLIMSDFTNFTNYVNNTYMTGDYSLSEINVTGNYSNVNDDYYVGYMYRFDDYGNSTDFCLEVDLEYFYNGSMLRAYGLSIGSDYQENTTDFGTDKRIAILEIDDAWSGSGGKYYITSFPNGVKSQVEAGSLPTEGNITFIVSRNITGLYCTIKQNSVVVLAQEWTEDIYRPLNHIEVWGSINPIYTDYSTGVFKNLDGMLFFYQTEPDDNTPTPTPTPTSTWPTLSFGFKVGYFVLGGLILEIIVLSFMRKKKQH